ncbi:MAG TPA: recombination-associated protein RdgC [Pseudomonadales bacterium]|nr:recombination-associated protein RdgC [Pseudomonadales bacterium]
MWFKNLRIYRLTGELPCPAEDLGERLADAAFVPCAGMDTRRIGWVSPMGPTATHLVHSVNDFHLVCARTQQKLLPAAAIREVLDEKILEIETAEGRKLHKRERANLKDETIQTLLPRALTRSQLSFAFLAAARGLLLIDSPNAARAEDLLNLLRESLGRLSVRPLAPRHNPVEIMTRWLGGTRLPAGFSLGQHCDLRDPLNAANVVRCRQQDLATREVREHLDAGKQVGALGLSWKERVAFVLAEDLAVKAIKYPEIVRNESGVDPELDAAARFDADFALMSLELDQLAAELIEVFGIAED